MCGHGGCIFVSASKKSRNLVGDKCTAIGMASFNKGIIVAFSPGSELRERIVDLFILPSKTSVLSFASQCRSQGTMTIFFGRDGIANGSGRRGRAAVGANLRVGGNNQSEAEPRQTLH